MTVVVGLGMSAVGLMVVLLACCLLFFAFFECGAMIW